MFCPWMTLQSSLSSYLMPEFLSNINSCLPMFQIQAVKNWNHYLQDLACFLACDSLAEAEKSFRQVRRESFQAGHICIVPFSLESSKSEGWKLVIPILTSLQNLHQLQKTEYKNSESRHLCRDVLVHFAIGPGLERPHIQEGTESVDALLLPLWVLIYSCSFPAKR